MTHVWERYPNGGGEMLLALALADHAHDNGKHIFPSVDHLARKTRQSVRTVQYQLSRMKESGWLIPTNAGDGGRGLHTEYRISDEWLKGADIAPFKKGASDDMKGCNSEQERVQTTTENGATAIAPTNNHKEPSVEPSKNRQASPEGDGPSVLTAKHLAAEGVDKKVGRDWLTLRKAKRLPLTPTAWETIKAEAEKLGMSAAEAVKYAVDSNWAGFKASWVERDRANAGDATGTAQSAAAGEWWTSRQGVMAKAAELGMTEGDGEIFLSYRVRVCRKAGEGPWRQHILKEFARDEAMTERLNAAFYPKESDA